jgi:hypothetical protein
MERPMKGVKDIERVVVGDRAHEKQMWAVSQVRLCRRTKSQPAVIKSLPYLKHKNFVCWFVLREVLLGWLLMADLF